MKSIQTEVLEKLIREDVEWGIHGND